MTENPGTRRFLTTGDTVMLQPQGVSKFKILSIDEDGHAHGEESIPLSDPLAVSHEVSSRYGRF
ncbi:hypothetical protein CJ179_37370 [Rhodococcus sp. ACS1]|nr:hypothetical protein CJ179_37370 [Rhodococcus sp. ACS1]